MTRRHFPIPSSFGARAQRGAVLFVALMMLILLALLGLAGMQVASMQERMSANYRASNVAFQNSEGLARNAECTLENLENGTVTAGCNAMTPGQINRNCTDGFNTGVWAGSLVLATTTALTVRQIDQCIAGNSNIAMGEAINESTNKVFNVTAFMTDDPVNPAASTTVDTIFRP